MSWYLLTVPSFKHRAIRVYGGMHVTLRAPVALHPTESPSPRGTHWTGGWVVPRVGPDGAAKENISRLRRESNPVYLACNQSLN